MLTRPKTILYVEEDEADIRLVKRAFGAERMKEAIQAVPDGSEAIAWLDGEGDFEDRARYPLPQLLLLGMERSGGEGLRVLRWMRARSTFRGLPAIMFSGSFHDEDVEECYRLGATLFLEKPAQAEGLRQIARFLQAWARYSLPPPSHTRALETTAFRGSEPARARFPLHKPMGYQTWGD
jgi:CheY-like chemotaxis protein